MDPRKQDIARTCQSAAEDGSMDFPTILGLLMAEGFEGYAVDYRRQVATYYLPDDDSVTLDTHRSDRPIARAFDEAAVRAAIGWAQSGAADYSYRGFCDAVRAAGCIGYLVSLPGRRVVYMGRSGDMWTEHFPQ